jgi:hypothetical protein
MSFASVFPPLSPVYEVAKMFATPHMIAGVAIGMAVHRPELALPLAFASHFLLDAIPHVDGYSLYGKPNSAVTRPEVVVSVLDVLVGILLICAFVQGTNGHGWLYLAAFAGVVIDLFDNVPGICRWFRACALTSWLSVLHNTCHHDTPLFCWRHADQYVE